MEGTLSRAIDALGILGHVAKGLALMVAGVLFLASAVFTDPGPARGLDGALKWVATVPLGGGLLLVIVASGFIAYGCYLFARARFLRRGPMVVTSVGER